MATMVLVCLVVLVIFIAGVALRRQQRQWPGQLPPGPPSWPIVGSLHCFLGAAPHRSLARLSQHYGPFVFMKLGSVPAVVVSSAEVAKLFLQTHDKTFASRPPLEAANHINYAQDIAVATTPYGEEWRDLRRLYMVQLFTAKRVKECMPILAEEIESLMKEIREYAETGGVAFDLTAGLGKLIENIVCRILLGKRLAEVRQVKEGYNLKKGMDEGAQLFGIPLVGDMIPWLGFLDRTTTRRMDAWRASVDALLESLLHARNKEAASSSHNDDFLQVLLANHLPRDKVKGVILELLGAGIGTSSVTLDWAMAELLTNREAMTKVEHELEQVLGYASDNKVQEGDLTKLVYLKAVIKETFRLHAPLPLLITHMSTRECQVGGYTLPQGTRILINAWAIGRDPKSWYHSNLFVPDRFLNTPKHLDVRGQSFELIPFGSGRRSCPGMSIALPIVEMTLAHILYHFRWSLPPPPHNKVDMEERFGLVLSRANPLLATPTLRSL